MKNYVDKDKLQEYTTKLNTKLKTIFATKAEVGSPLKASTVAEMTDESRIYVYTGSESGYTAGNWYYYNGSAWTSGGVYNSTAFETDTTLAVPGMAADAKAVGDALAGVQVDTDTTLTQSGVPADAKATGDAIGEVENNLSNLENEFDEKVGSKYETIEPTNWYNANATTSGIMNVDGTVTQDADYLYTDYIPVKEGDIIGCFRDRNYNRIYHHRIAVFDENKNAISNKGSNSNSSNNFTIQSGISYAIVTFKLTAIPSSIKPIIVRDGVTPTSYSAYFEPYEALIEDFLTDASEAAIQKLVNNTLSTKDLKNKYGCALPKGVPLYQTVGLPETWYYDSAVTPKTKNIIISAGAQHTQRYNDKFTFLNNTALSTVNGFSWSYYDLLLNLIDYENGSAEYGRPRKIIEENLSDCSLLAIGDSTVDHDTMTATLLSHFTEQGHTITLLGTLGDDSGTNKNEGRAGWKAEDYFTNKQYRGVTNPFFNPTTETFDFAYYMTNQGYSAPDFVVIQLGINDLYNYDDTKIEPTWNYIKGMIDSILAYNQNIKVILNLPTTPNSDQSQHSNVEFLYRNRIIRYDEYAMRQSLSVYGTSKVRCSYCHLILNPDTEIRDNVHPTMEGYQKMALEVINQINCWQNGV